VSRRPKNPLRPLTEDEGQELTRLSRGRAQPAARVARALMLRAGADGSASQPAARAAGRQSGDAGSHLVARFNREGLAALAPRPGGGHKPADDGGARDRILREAARTPTPPAEGTATWSLTILRRVLRAAPDGRPRVSTVTIWRVLRGAGDTFPRTRTGCPTGSAVGRRKAGVVTVNDPDAAAPTSGVRTRTPPARHWGGRWAARTRPGPSRRPRTPAHPGRREVGRHDRRTSTCVAARPRCSPCSARPTGPSGSRGRLPVPIPYCTRG
jgi:hypothetical protein